MKARKINLTRLDRAIGYIAPGWAARRAIARLRFEAATSARRAVRAYYNGATIGRRSASIRYSLADVNAVTRASLPRLRQASRDLVRNGLAKRAVEAIVSNTIGHGILPIFLRNCRRATEVAELARRHLETTACDVDGRHTYAGLQSIALQAIVEGGDVIVRRRWRRPTDGLPAPVQFQILEAEFLDESKDGPLPDGGVIIQGVEYDAIGRRRAYWLFREHPGSRRLHLESVRVPARDVIHVFRTERPGQARGIPWGAPALLRHADWDDFEDAQLVRQKIAACFAGFIEEAFDSGVGLPNVLGAQTEEDSEGNLIDTFEPGMIERLPPGTKITFATPPDVSGYAEYSNVTLHTIAALWGVSYEALTGDLRGVNFSSGKMGRNEFERNIERWQKLMLIPQLCEPMVRWFLEAVELAHGIPTADVVVRHIPPPREMIDPPREIRSNNEAIRSGQKTLTEVIRERGRDPIEHLTEFAQDLELLDELGLILDCDPRRRTAYGQPTEYGGGTPAPAEEDQEEGDDELMLAALAFENGNGRRNGSGRY